MRIERVDTFPLFYRLSEPYGDANGYKHYRTCYLLRVTTASGLTGWGECVDFLPLVDAGFKKRIIPYLIGKQATDRLKITAVIKKWHQRAAAAVSMALTEITAKKAGLSICDIWGGKLRERIPVYASFQSYSDRPDWISHSLQSVEKKVQEGFDTVKLKVGGRSFSEDAAHLDAFQELSEETIRFIIDANQSYDLAAARRWEHRLAAWRNLLWFEEPMPFDDLAEYRMLRLSSAFPIAGGENMKGAKQFLPLLLEHAVDIIQPDYVHGYGTDDFQSALKLARHFGRRVSPHSFDGALSRLYAAFGQACLSPWSKMDGEDIEPLEWDVMENPFTKIVDIQLKDGYLQVPDKIEVDTDLIKAYLWDGTNYG